MKMKPEHIINITGCCLLFPTLAFGIWTLMSDPLAPSRTVLEERLTRDPQLSQDAQAREMECMRWAQMIVKHPKVWAPLTVLKVVEVAPTPPNLLKMLEGVEPLRGQMGDRVKFKLPNKAKPEYLRVGDSVNGCTIKNITAAGIMFAVYWKEGKTEVTYVLPRK